jgi:ectoine hydroxylase
MSFFRRLKCSYLLHNFWHRKQLLCNEDVYAKYGLQKKVTSLLAHKDVAHLTITETPWLDDTAINTETITSKTGFENFDTVTKNALTAWPSNGYAILPNLFSTQECDIILQEIEALQTQQKAQQRLDDRIIFAIHKSEKINALATKPSLINVLQFILGKPVRLFQSLNFTHGSKQRAHSDTIHMTTHPLGYMVAAWVALEDIHADSGPLFYYPGSHKLPYVLNEDYKHEGNYFLHDEFAYKKYEDAIDAIIVNNNLNKQHFLAKKGDVFVWHANILHGGSPIVNNTLTRKSMVLHYFAQDVICYHEITERPAIFGGYEAHCPK